MSKTKINVVQQNDSAIKALKGYLEYLNFSNPSKCKEYLTDQFFTLGIGDLDEVLMMHAQVRASLKEKNQLEEGGSDND